MKRGVPKGYLLQLVQFLLPTKYMLQDSYLTVIMQMTQFYQFQINKYKHKLSTKLKITVKKQFCINENKTVKIL